VLTRKHSPASARTRIFDGASEAKLIALAYSEPPKGRARWTFSLLEDKVVELNIVAKASDNTIGRTQKNILRPHLKEQFVYGVSPGYGHPLEADQRSRGHRCDGFSL
jgi:hypothetical protein